MLPIKSLLLLLTCYASLALSAPATEGQRARFNHLYTAAAKGHALSAQQIEALAAYPLYSYLRYYRLRPRLRDLPAAEVSEFLRTFGGTHIGEKLRTEWLQETVRRGRFDLFDDAYVHQSDIELRCHALARELRQAPSTAASKLGTQIWLTGKSQPPACDALFAELRAKSMLSDRLVWQRIVLAAQAGNPLLSISIAKRYARASDQALAANFVKVANRPSSTLGIAALKHDTEQVRDIVAYGIARHARQQAGKAYGAWQRASKRYRFSDAQAGYVQQILAKSAVKQNSSLALTLLDEVNSAGIDNEIETLQLREGLRARAWTKLVRWTAAPPRGQTTNPLRWRYWQARALAETGQVDGAREIFTALARERDYYGFLASDKLNVPYTITHTPVAPSAEERARIAALGGVQRAAEFYRLGYRAQARQELEFEAMHGDKRQQEVAAHIVYEWGWYNQAIAMLGKVEAYDDLDLRFPLLHRELVAKYARQRQLPPALIYSIIRGESAFMTDARSVAGALGLMQLMPATGQATARQIGVSLKSDAELTRPDKNIALGSEYLRQMLRRFGGHFPLAAAAYNAGPGRVRGWLAQTSCAPADVWIDTIPFTETEAYVRRALFYAAIYEHRLGIDIAPLATRMAAIGGAATARGQC